jgi:hypothetical protein
MESERTIDGVVTGWRTVLEFAPDICGNRQHNHFPHDGSPLIKQYKNMNVQLQPVPSGGNHYLPYRLILLI